MKYIGSNYAQITEIFNNLKSRIFNKPFNVSYPNVPLQQKCINTGKKPPSLRQLMESLHSVTQTNMHYLTHIWSRVHNGQENVMLNHVRIISIAADAVTDFALATCCTRHLLRPGRSAHASASVCQTCAVKQQRPSLTPLLIDT